MSILFWVLMAIGLAVVEIVSVTFFPIFFAASALLAAVVHVSGGSPLLEWAVFGLGGVVLSFGLRPLAKRQLDKGPTLQNSIATMKGRAGVVSTAIDGRAGTGAVTVDGEVWSAKPAGNGLGQIPAGADVEIHEVRGATLIVAPFPTTEVP
ncbi:MAG: NfeD family protein [Solirubrobacteraceae bacterium]|nr:NfeD family protein [Solirubrobacteraceae bacterium]